MSQALNVSQSSQANATTPSAPIFASAPKPGHLLLEKGTVKAVQHLNAFIKGNENGTAFLQRHAVAAFFVRAITRFVALTGIGYAGMRLSAALVDKIDRDLASKRNKELKTSQKQLLELFKNYVPEHIRPNQRPSTVSEARDRLKLQANDVKLQKALDRLVRSVNVKVGNLNKASQSEQDFQLALEKYKDAINYFLKKAEKMGLPNSVIHDGQMRLVDTYYKNLVAKLGKDYASQLPDESKLRSDSLKLAEFARSVYAITEEQVGIDIAMAIHLSLGTESEEKLQKELEEKIKSFDQPDNEIVIASKKKLEKEFGIDLVDADKSQSENLVLNDSIGGQLMFKQGALKTQKEQLAKLNQRLIGFFSGLKTEGLSKDKLEAAQKAPDAEETNALLDDAIPQSQTEEEARNAQKLFKEVIPTSKDRAELKASIAKLEQEIHALAKQLDEAKEKIADDTKIKEELKAPYQKKLEILEQIKQIEKNPTRLKGLRELHKSAAEPQLNPGRSLVIKAQVDAIKKILKDIHNPNVSGDQIKERIEHLANHGRRVYEILDEKQKIKTAELGTELAELEEGHFVPQDHDRDALSTALEIYLNELLARPAAETPTYA